MGGGRGVKEEGSEREGGREIPDRGRHRKTEKLRDVCRDLTTQDFKLPKYPCSTYQKIHRGGAGGETVGERVGERESGRVGERVGESEVESGSASQQNRLHLDVVVKHCEIHRRHTHTTDTHTHTLTQYKTHIITHTHRCVCVCLGCVHILDDMTGSLFQ